MSLEMELLHSRFPRLAHVSSQSSLRYVCRTVSRIKGLFGQFLISSMLLQIFIVSVNSVFLFGNAFLVDPSSSVRHVPSSTGLRRSGSFFPRSWSPPTATQSRTCLASSRSNEGTSSAASLWRDEGHGASTIAVALREMRRQIDSEAAPEEVMKILVDDIITAGAPEVLVTEASVILERYRPLAEAAERGDVMTMLRSAASASPTRDVANVEGAKDGGNYLLDTVETEVIDELRTPWDEAIKKWRKKALAVEKYRSTNPTANAVVYTYMVNCCTRQGMWEVAYDALTYAGLMSAGPFFLSRKDLGFGSPSLVLDVDKMACYVAEKILDMDLDVWRRKGGDVAAGQGAVGNRKPGVGVEEMNFSQNDESSSHLAALRVQDMTLAATRVALRKIRTQLRDTPSKDFAGPSSLIILCSTTTTAKYLRELLVPPRAIETLFALDFAAAVDTDAEHGRRLADDSNTAAALGLLAGASKPFVLCGEGLEAWIAQKDDINVEVDTQQ